MNCFRSIENFHNIVDRSFIQYTTFYINMIVMFYFRKDIDKLEKINAYREAMKRVKINASNMPSICLYTINNAFMGYTFTLFQTYYMNFTGSTTQLLCDILNIFAVSHFTDLLVTVDII